MKVPVYFTAKADRTSRDLKFFSLLVSSMDMRCMR